MKNPMALADPGQPIEIPVSLASQKVDYECELVVVIGKVCKNVKRPDALDCVLGYTCGNDVSAREWQRGDLQWWRGKSSDTFAPFGPFIVTGLDPSKLDLRCRINGKEVQGTSTSALFFDVPTLVSFISQVVTMEPGDLIYTGTPGTPGAINAGDLIEIEISVIGVLRNAVVA